MLMFLHRSDEGSFGRHFPHLLVSLLQLAPDLLPDLLLLVTVDGVPVISHQIVLDGLLVPLQAVLTERPHLSPDLSWRGPGLCNKLVKVEN